MADISKITLPNGDSYDIKDNGAVRINDGTLTGTTTAESLLSDEIVAGSLIVNGDSRFVNPINGDLVGDVTGNVVGNVSGSAGTAGAFTSAKSVTLTGDVTGSASSTGGWSVATTVKDDSHNHTATTIVPKMTKSYTGLIGTENNASNGSFYFIKVVPDTFNGNWYIDYKLTCTMNGVSDANGGGRQNCHVKIYGMRNTYSGYDIWNSISNTSYRSIYYHNFYRAKSAGISYGHAIGVGFRNAYGPTNSTYARNITVEVLDYQGCTVSLLDTAVKYANWTGTGSTNYDGLTEFDAYTNGRRMTGDNNDITTLQYSTSRLTAGTNGLPGYSIVMMKPNGTWEGLTIGNATTATTSTKNTSGFVLGQMYWYQSGTNIASGSITGTSTIRTAQDWADFRYTSNCGSTLTNNKMIYIKGTITNGLFYLADTWWTQDLPTTADGFVYIPVGICYGSGYAFCFWGWHGAYYHNGTTIVEYHISSIPDWDENDSTSPSYIENRTHYRTSLGYSYRLTASNHYWYGDTYNITFGSVSKTYNYESAGQYDFTYINEINHTDFSAFDNTVTSVVASISDDNAATNHTLTVYIDNNEECIWLYDNAFAILLGIENENGEYSYPLYAIYVNNNYASLHDDGPMVVTIDMNVPLTTEQFEYTKKLDSGYLNGKLIISGTGNGSEIFNEGMSGTIASGGYSHAEGIGTTASGYVSHAEGYVTEASGGYSHAEGAYSKASGNFSHAEGEGSKAFGNDSHAEGYQSLANGRASHAEGYYIEMGWNPIKISGAANTNTYTTTSSLVYIQPEALIGLTIDYNGIKGEIVSYTVNSNDSSQLSSITLNKTLNPNTAISNVSIYPSNRFTAAKGNYSHAEGMGTIAEGEASHSEGDGTIASGNYSHAEGEMTKASGEATHAEGQGTIASSNMSHAEGAETIASGRAAHAEGIATIASKGGAHAEGSNTTASGDYSHAEGYGSTASGKCSHAEGYGTTAQRRSQHVFGEYNTLDTGGSSATTKGTYIEIVGKGTSDSARSNARTLDWSGNETLAGSITLGKGTSDEVTLTPAKLKQLLALL